MRIDLPVPATGSGRAAESALWIAVARSCHDCNQIAVQLFQYPPTPAQQQALKDAIGGMWCIRLDTFALVPDGDAAEGPLHDD